MLFYILYVYEFTLHLEERGLNRILTSFLLTLGCCEIVLKEILCAWMCILVTWSKNDCDFMNSE